MMADNGPETQLTPLQVGDRAPQFTLPAVDHEGTVSLADYSRRPLLLGFFRGIYCPFCRRAIVHMGCEGPHSPISLSRGFEVDLT